MHFSWWEVFTPLRNACSGSLRFCDTYYDTELYPLRIHLLAVKDRAEPWNYPSDGLKIKNGS